jgi:hypothetical protein
MGIVGCTVLDNAHLGNNAVSDNDLERCLEAILAAVGGERCSRIVGAIVGSSWTPLVAMQRRCCYTVVIVGYSSTPLVKIRPCTTIHIASPLVIICNPAIAGIPHSCW